MVFIFRGIIFALMVIVSLESYAGNSGSRPKIEEVEEKESSEGAAARGRSLQIIPRGEESLCSSSPISIRKIKPEITVSEGSWFFHLIQARDFPVIATEPVLTYGGPVIGKGVTPTLHPISESHNNWPSNLGNVSLYPYLIGYGEASRYPEFCAFVQEYYKTSCAIMYYPECGYPKVIGSGSLVNTNLVSTARHNFEGIAPSKLYVRFFDYRVAHTSKPHYLRVEENYIDIPVLDFCPALGGLDAGFLNIEPVTEVLASRFMKVLPTTKETYRDGFTTLPPGRYAMLHFAGGKHLLSTGHVENFGGIGAPLHNNIAIEAGPGASGAAVIQKNFTVSSHGISIYRNIINDMETMWVERRVIPFERFFNPGTITDSISAPYVNPSFFVVPPMELEQSGYEFLAWNRYLHAGQRVNKPGGYDKIYEVQDGAIQSVHHIIPIFDLLFLWDYLNPPHPLNIGYKPFRDVMSSLCPPRLNGHGKLQLGHDGIIPTNFTRTHFAWAWWNLFKGWSAEYRQDDSRFGDEKGDWSEKRKPSSFPEGLWNSVKTLYCAIQNLKQPPYRAEENHRLLFGALQKLQEVWFSMYINSGKGEIKFPTIHEFNEEEWVEVGYVTHPRFGNHPVYQVK